MATNIKPEAATPPPHPTIMDMEQPLDDLEGLSCVLMDMAIAAAESCADPVALRFLSNTALRIHRELAVTWDKCRQENREAREDAA